jgi:hypothetical protein
MHRPIALVLLVTLLAALLPASQGAGCRVSGKAGRCCCLPAQTAAHCMMHGRRPACSIDRSAALPAALRAPEMLPERPGAFTALALPAILASCCGLLAATAARRPSPFYASPPTPPPRILRLV